MEKNCINCKWYYNQQCNNSKLQIVKEDNTYWNIVKYIEDGILSEQIKENVNLNKLANSFINVILDLGYIKKNCINKALNETYEDTAVEIYENIESIISNMLIGYFKNNGLHVVKVNINDPNNFYCCNWE